VNDVDGITNPDTARAMQAIYDRIREFGDSPGLIALADRVSARVRNEESDSVQLTEGNTDE